MLHAASVCSHHESIDQGAAGDAPRPTPEPAFERPSLRRRLLSAAAVVVPLLGLCAAGFLFWDRGLNWVHLGLLIGGYLLTLLGITIGYHRLFTHRSFETNAVVKAVLGVLGSMAAQGPILHWVATHRLHHQHSDDAHDPHSPHAHGGGLVGLIRGMYHAHFGWFFAPAKIGLDRYVADLRSDRVVRWVSRLFFLWVALGVMIPGVIALAITGAWSGFLLGLIWGGLVRIFLVHHVSWSVNSVCHLWGTRPFRSRDESRNNIIFGVLAFGEGWHNAHHAFPTSARHGLRWWELDLSYLIIRAMALVGLATAVRVPPADRIAAKRQRSGAG